MKIFLAILALLMLAALQGVTSEQPLIGTASWYGEELRGRLTANGEPFNPDLLTAACWHYPLGTRLLVTNLANGKSVVVRVNDRGPARRLKRVIDLSQAAFRSIASLDSGLIRVKIEKL